jgi:signal transduction histidine kinase
MMNWETFAERLNDAQARLQNLRLQYADIERFSGGPDGGADPRTAPAPSTRAAPVTAQRSLGDALTELDAAFNELATAQDELRIQTEQLADARRDLAEQRRRYRMLFVSAPAAYLVTTPEGVVCDANQQAGALFNVRPKFLIGKPLVVYVASAARRGFHDRLHQLRTPGTICDDWLIEMQPRARDCFDASATVVCGIEPTQQHTELQWLIFDVTARRREERALQQAKADLEQRVAERTRELEAASRAKDDFLASLSHELRTPVNVIRGFARMLRSGALDADSSARAIDAIDRNAARQTRLVADLLDVARINAGKFALRQQRTDLRLAIVAARETVLASAEGKKVRFTLHMPDAAVWVWGDAERLQQVFDNLLSNAIKFTPANGEVALEMVPEGPGWRVSVRDTGIGIAPEFLPHVFERFRQADSSTSSYGGLGLGLSIVQYIIQMHGGSVAAYSAGRGRGATFSCTLPSYVPQALPEQTQDHV